MIRLASKNDFWWKNPKHIVQPQNHLQGSKIDFGWNFESSFFELKKQEIEGNRRIMLEHPLDYWNRVRSWVCSTLLIVNKIKKCCRRKLKQFWGRTIITPYCASIVQMVLFHSWTGDGSGSSPDGRISLHRILNMLCKIFQKLSKNF